MLLVLPGESLPGGLTGHPESVTDSCPADTAGSQGCYVMSDSAIDVLVGAMGTNHLRQQIVVG